jgi:hypothetical protein
VCEWILLSSASNNYESGLAALSTMLILLFAVAYQLYPPLTRIKHISSTLRAVQQIEEASSSPYSIHHHQCDSKFNNPSSPHHLSPTNSYHVLFNFNSRFKQQVETIIIESPPNTRLRLSLQEPPLLADTSISSTRAAMEEILEAYYYTCHFS